MRKYSINEVRIINHNYVFGPCVYSPTIIMILFRSVMWDLYGLVLIYINYPIINNLFNFSF